jgi:hypothetical protein
LSTLDGRRQRPVSEALKDLGRTLWMLESRRIPRILEIEDFRKGRKEGREWGGILTDLGEECDLRTETLAAAAVQRSMTPPGRIDLDLVARSLQLVVGPLGILLPVQWLQPLDWVVEVAKLLALVAAVAWKVVSKSVGELSER